MALKDNPNGALAVHSARAADLLSRLHEGHENLAQAMAAADEVTRQAFDPPGLAGARWRCGAANRARRAVWEECYLYLLPLVDPAAAKALAELRSQDLELALASTMHTARWPAEAVAREWQDYCRASRSLRGRIRQAMKAERKLVSPLLATQRCMQPLKRFG